MPTASVVEFLNQKKRTIDALVDTTYAETMKREGNLNPYMQKVDYQSKRLLVLQINKKPTIAYIQAEGEDVKYVKPRADLTERELSDCKIVNGRMWLAEDFEAIHNMRMMLESSMPSARAEGQALIDHYMSSVAMLVPGIDDLKTLFQIKVYTTGECVFSDPFSEYDISISYAGDIPSGHLPAALTGGSRWDQYSTANGILDIRNHARTFFRTLRFYPEAVAMSIELIWDLIEQDSTKLAVAQLRGLTPDAANSSEVAAIQPATIEELERIIARSLNGHMMKIVPFDETYNQPNQDGTVTEGVRFLPTTHYVFLTPGMGERAGVPTVERDFQIGVFTENKIVETSPRKERSIAIACAIPFVKDPRMIAARQVKS